MHIFYIYLCSKDEMQLQKIFYVLIKSHTKPSHHIQAKLIVRNVVGDSDYFLKTQAAVSQARPAMYSDYIAEGQVCRCN